jgi:hypothetical protein
MMAKHVQHQLSKKQNEQEFGHLPKNLQPPLYRRQGNKDTIHWAWQRWSEKPKKQ